MATPTHSRTSFRTSLGTTKDARKIGKNLFPVHRKATISSSAASRFECCSSFVRCELAGCDVLALLVSRSCGSFRPTRPVHRRPRHRACRNGPPLRLPYVSTSTLLTFNGLLFTKCSATRRPTCENGYLRDFSHPSSWVRAVP